MGGETVKLMNSDTENTHNMQSQARRERNALRMRNRRANETRNGALNRRAAMAERARHRRALENGDEAQLRRVDGRERLRNIKANEMNCKLNKEEGCEFCSAIKFENEDEFKCCNKGKVSLPDLNEFPQELRYLILRDSVQAKHFRTGIRVFRNCFALASLSANIGPPPGNGPSTFRICGQIVHRYGTLFPEQEQPQFSQLYIIEAAQALDIRMQNP